MREDDAGRIHDFRFLHLREWEPWERKYHFHEVDSLIVLPSGHAGYEVENDSYELGPWEIILTKRHTIQRAIADPDGAGEHFILFIDEQFIQRMMPMNNIMECFDTADRRGNHKVVMDTVSQARFSRLLDAFETSLMSDRYGEEVLRITLVLQILIQIGQSMQDCVFPEESPKTRYGGKLDQLLRYIDGNLDRNLTVEQLAAMAYLSRYHFMRLFKEKTGITVHGYIRQKRLLQAARLIRNGVPINQAAANSGYLDYSSFYRAFRDCFGASPSEIKQDRQRALRGERK